MKRLSSHLKNDTLVTRPVDKSTCLETAWIAKVVIKHSLIRFPNLIHVGGRSRKAQWHAAWQCCIPLPTHPKAIGMLCFLQMDHKWHTYSWCALALGEWDCICQLAHQPDLIWKRMVHSCCRNSKEQIFNHPPFLPVQSHPLIGKWEAQSAQIRGKMCHKQPVRQKTEVPTPWYHDLAAVYKSDLANQRVPGSN